MKSALKHQNSSTGKNEGMVIQRSRYPGIGQIGTQQPIAEIEIRIQHSPIHSQRKLSSGTDDQRRVQRQRALLQLNTPGKGISQTTQRCRAKAGLYQGAAAAQTAGG